MGKKKDSKKKDVTKDTVDEKKRPPTGGDN